MPENLISGTVVDAAFRVHDLVGPGLLESTYVAALTVELRLRGLTVQREVPIPALYRGVDLGVGYRADLVVNQSVIVEVKASDNVAKVHKRQLLTYLRHSGLRLGLLLNFGLSRMKEGIHRVANGLPDSASQ